jgi:hypothetical protein
MVEVPALRAFATPAESIVATVGSDDVHPTRVVISAMLLSEYVPCAWNARFVPAMMLGLAGVRSIFVRVTEPLDVTLSETVAVRVREPPVAVTVTGNVPRLAFAVAVKFRLELPEPGAPIEDGVNVAVTPLGSPEADNATELLKPPTAWVVMPIEALLPCWTVTVPGDVVTVKSGVEAVPIT